MKQAHRQMLGSLSHIFTITIFNEEAESIEDFLLSEDPNSTIHTLPYYSYYLLLFC